MKTNRVEPVTIASNSWILLIIVFLFAPTTVYAQTIAVRSAVVTPDSVVSIPVEISDDVLDIFGFQLDVDVIPSADAPSLSIENIGKGAVVTTAPDIDTNPTVPTLPGVRIGLPTEIPAPGDLRPSFDGPGSIVDVEFLIPSDATAGQTYQVNLSNVILAGPGNGAVPVTVFGGTLTVGSATALADTIQAPSTLNISEGEEVALTVTVSGGGQPIPGVWLKFSIDDPMPATVSTDLSMTGTDGIARVNISGEKHGNTNIRISATGLAEAVVNLTISGVSPAITSTPNLEAAQGIAYTYDVDATDPQDQTLTYSLLVAPAGMGIDSESGEITWASLQRPPPDEPTVNVTVQVNDPDGNTDSQSFTLAILIDGDNDGYDDRTDCDDANGQINPGATENPYDGLDNDCDAATPDDDIDGDGHPDAADCNDSDPSVNPDAPEVCDGKDNDCDGEIDEGFPPITYYQDNDGDGFGDPADTLENCFPSPPNGYVANSQDCDDTDPDVNPAMTEILYNGKDDDCNPATFDNLDYLVAVDDIGRIYYARSNGDGTFSDYSPLHPLVGDKSRSVTINDFDNDGDMDFVAGRRILGNAHYFYFQNQGNNRFAEKGLVGTLDGETMDMASGDFNNDGFMDFIADVHSSITGLYLGDGRGNFTKTEMDLGAYGRGMDTADFDHDGNLDFARGRWNTGYIDVYWGDGTGAFSASTRVGDSGKDPYGVVAGDFNNDGHVDVIADYGNRGDAQLWTGNGDRTFAHGGFPGTLDINDFGSFDAFDFNGDGNLDIVGANARGRDRGVYYFAGNGDGTFGASVKLGSTSAETFGISAPPIGPPGAPAARIQPTTQTIARGGTADFDGSGSFDPDGSLVSWLWDFKDGTSEFGTGSDVGETAHDYADEGVYSSTLKVTDDDGKTGITAAVVIVEGNKPVVDTAAVVFGEAHADDGLWRPVLMGSDYATDTEGVVDYHWDFGDGFSETFEDGAADGWSIFGGNWEISDVDPIEGNYSFRQSHTGLDRARVLSNKVFDDPDLTIEAQIKLVSGEQEAMILFRAMDNTNHYEFWIRGRGLNDVSVRTVVNNSVINDIEYDLPSNFPSYPIGNGTTYRVKIVCTGSLMQFYLDDVYLFAHYDNTYLSGKVGFCIYRTNALFDNLTVKETATGESVRHTFEPGTYRVMLTATDGAGQSAADTIPMTMQAQDPPQPDAGSPYEADESAAFEGGWTFNLDGSISSDDVEVSKYVWHFGEDTFDGSDFQNARWFTNGDISQNDEVSLTGRSAWDTRYMVTKSIFPRANGQTFQAKFKTPPFGHCMVGFKNESTDNFHHNQFPHAFYFDNGNILIYEDGNRRGDTGFNYAGNTWYDVRIELKAAGAAYAYRPSGAMDWIEVYRSNYTAGDTNLRKGMVAHNGIWLIDDFVETTAGVNSAYTLYRPAGTFDVELIVYDPANQADTDFTTVTLSGKDYPAADAGPDQTKSETDAVEETWTVDFDASGSTDDYGIFIYEWDWDYDGTFDPSGDTGVTASHTWNGIGTYTVAVRVTDHALQTHVDSMTVTINRGAAPTAEAGGPYSFDEETGSAFQGCWTVSLDGSGSADAETDIAWHLWDLGLDTFDGIDVNPVKWVHSSNVAQNNEISVAGTGKSWGQRYLFSKNTYTRAKGLAFEAKVKVYAVKWCKFMIGFKNSNQNYHYQQMPYAIYFYDRSIHIYEDGASRGYTGRNFSYNTWYEVRIELKEPSGARHYYRKLGDPDWILLYDSDYSSETTLKLGTHVHSGTFIMDDLKEMASGETPSHVVCGSGSRAIRLTVWDHGGQSHTDETTLTTMGNDPPVPDAGPDRAGDETDTHAGWWTYDFSAAGSSDDFGIYTYEWDWDYDGTFDPSGDTGAAVSHTYIDGGIRTVALRVTDHALQTSIDTATVAIVPNNPPTADAGGPYHAGVGGPPAYFDGSGSSDDHGIVKYLWDADDTVDSDGDRNFSNDLDAVGRTPLYTYTAAGTYTATLTVKDIAAGTATSTATVNVAENSAPDVICVPWVASNPRSHHETYNGRAVRLKAIARDGKENVLMNTGTGGNYDANFYRTEYSLGDDDAATIAFKVDAGNTDAHFSIEASTGTGGWGSYNYHRFGIVARDNRIYAQVHEMPARFTQTLINPIKINIWYVLTIKLDDAGLFYLKVHERANPADYAEYAYNMPGGLSWRFHHWNYRNTAYLDNYQEDGLIDAFNDHDAANWVYSQHQTVPHGDDGNLTFQWDFGDGSPPYPATPGAVTDKYAIEAEHTYPDSPDGTPFTATLTVWDQQGLADSDNYYVIIKPDNLDTRTNIAIDEGLWWMHRTQDKSNGSWKTTAYGDPYSASPTASVVQAFEINGHLQEGDNCENPYVETVNDGFDYMFTTLRSRNIGHQTHGNPDTNGNGIGIEVNSSFRIYEGGMVMDAIASSNTPPLAYARTGGANIKGMYYYHILTDMVDMYAAGQDDHGGGRGGWRYSWDHGSDNSACQWAAIGMMAAEDNFGIKVSLWVKNQNNAWLNSSYDGTGFGYTNPGNGVAQTPSGMVQLAFCEKTTDDPRWQTAENYIANNWYWQENNYYAAYALAKALRLALPEPVVTLSATGLDWYNDPTTGVRKRIVDQQELSGDDWGRWPNMTHGGPSLCTPWAVIMLTPTLFVQPPVAEAGDDIIWAYDLPLSFDASDSFHLDPSRTIVKYEWDFDGDGTWDFETTDPSDPDAIYTYADQNPDTAGDQAQTFMARLRVTDDNEPSQTDVDTREVTMSDPPHAPFAVHGGPYTATAGIPFSLDGSASYDIDPGDAITRYQWDLDDDGAWFDDVDLDTTSAGANYTFDSSGIYNVGLKVWDNGTFNPVGCTVGVDCISIASIPVFTTVEVVVNQPPVAEAGGPYAVDEGTELILNGSASSDPNGDVLVFAWDLDNDGDYDDSTAADPAYTWMDDGTYTVGLEVSDSLLADTAIAEVVVNDLSPSAAFIWVPQAQTEGSTVSFTDQSTSYPDSIVSWSWNFAGQGNSNEQNPSFTFNDNGDYTVTLMVMDDDGSTNAVSHAVSITDKAPLASLTGDTTLGEGASGSYDANGSSSSPDIIVLYEWDLDDDGQYDDAIGATVTHTWLDNGVYPVAIRITDDDGSTDTATMEITVSNVAPTVDAGPDAVINEGDTFNSGGSISDPGADTWTATVDYGEGAGPQLLALNPDNTFGLNNRYEDNGVYTVTVAVTDDDGGVGIDTATVTVNNVAPTVDAGPDDVIDEGDTLSSAGLFIDPGADTWTATVDYGDGSGAQPLTLNPDKTFALSHVYADDGAYTVTVTVTDDDGGGGAATRLP